MMTTNASDLAIGGRIGMRNAARQLLEAIDQLAEHELQQAGYTLDEITMLERIAMWRIEGVPFGDWPTVK